MKTTRILILAAVAAVMSSGLAGCINNDDRHSLNRFVISLATVDNPDNSIFYFFTLDNGTRMWIASTNVHRFRPETGQRILANYTILSNRGEGSSFDHDVRLNNVYRVLTKDIIGITDENDAEIGDDPYRSVNMWVSGDWLNVEFLIDAFNGRHLISVGEDLRTGAEPSEEGTVRLQLRRNGHGDPQVRRMWGMASFDLLPLRIEGQTQVTLLVEANITGVAGGRTFEMVYNYGNPQVPAIEVDMEQEQAELE